MKAPIALVAALGLAAGACAAEVNDAGSNASSADASLIDLAGGDDQGQVNPPDPPGESDAEGTGPVSPGPSEPAAPGELGAPCDEPDDCYSGFCIITPDGKACTETCDEECPAGWGCRQLVQGDPIFLCLPKWLHLCDPCQTTSDCVSDAGDVGHYCLDRGELHLLVVGQRIAAFIAKHDDRERSGEPESGSHGEAVLGSAHQLVAGLLAPAAAWLRRGSAGGEEVSTT